MNKRAPKLNNLTSILSTKNSAYSHRKVHSGMSKNRKVVTVLTGDGIGPELCTAAIGVLQASQAPVEFETFTLPPMIRIHDPLIPTEVLARFFIHVPTPTTNTPQLHDTKLNFVQFKYSFSFSWYNVCFSSF
jgi:hypothetical protein